MFILFVKQKKKPKGKYFFVFKIKTNRTIFFFLTV